MPRDAHTEPEHFAHSPAVWNQYFAADRLMFDPRVALTRSVRWS